MGAADTISKAADAHEQHPDVEVGESDVVDPGIVEGDGASSLGPHDGQRNRDARLRRSDFRTSLTPRKMRALVEPPSRAARDFSFRYISSGMSYAIFMARWRRCRIALTESETCIGPDIPADLRRPGMARR